MSKFIIGARLHDGNGLKFAAFCVPYKVQVVLEERSTLLFGENDHDAIMELWSMYCAEDLAKVCAQLGIPQ